MIGKAKHAARRDKFHDIGGAQCKSPLAKPQQDERFQRDFGDDAHSESCEPSDLSCSFLSSACSVLSSSVSSSTLKNPSGRTTGTTVWSRAVRPRYHSRSSRQNACGSACR